MCAAREGASHWFSARTRPFGRLASRTVSPAEQLAHLGFRFLPLDGLVRANGGAARLGDLSLAVTLQRADPPLGIDANVRSEEYEQPAGVGHVVEVRPKAGLARERQPAEAAEGKALSPARNHQVDKLLVLVVHLETAGELRGNGSIVAV